jgi:hypothetical protein
MALTLMLASGGIAHVVDMKAFLYGKFVDGIKGHADKRKCDWICGVS